jgi:multidrug efflux pump subunit AcrA (membrane-fusion protein)
MKARTVALLAILVVAAGFGGYALRGGLGGGTPAAGSGSASRPFAGGGRSPGGNGGGFARSGGFGGAAGAGGRAPTVTVQAVDVVRGPLVAQRTATGSVVPVTQSNVAAQASGTVKDLLVAVGDDVKAGQAIVQLNTDMLELAVANARNQLSTAQINLQTQQTNTRQATTQLQSQLASAQAALAAAEANDASAQKVYALGGTSKASVDSARSQLAQAQANVTSAQNALSQNQRAESESLQQLKLAVAQAQNGVKQAELSLANATIRAPFDGQVASFAVATGEYVGPSTSVATLVSAQRQVQLNVPPSDAAAFTTGTKLVFSTGVAQYAATVRSRPGAPVNQGVTVTASFDPASGEPPAVGVVGTVAYKVTLATATLVPISAIQNDGTNTFVFVIQGGKAVQTDLTILAQANSEAAVDGVPSGVTVVDLPPPGLLNGAPVQVAGASGSGGNAAPGAGARETPGARTPGGTAAPGGRTAPGARGSEGAGARGASTGRPGSGAATAGGTRPGGAPGSGAAGSRTPDGGRPSNGTSGGNAAPGGAGGQ